MDSLLLSICKPTLSNAITNMVLGIAAAFCTQGLALQQLLVSSVLSIRLVVRVGENLFSFVSSVPG